MKHGFGGDVGLNLLFEQARVQADLYQLRGLGEYNAFLFPGQRNGFVQETEISEFLRKDLNINLRSYY